MPVPERYTPRLRSCRVSGRDQSAGRVPRRFSWLKSLRTYSGGAGGRVRLGGRAGEWVVNLQPASSAPATVRKTCCSHRQLSSAGRSEQLRSAHMVTTAPLPSQCTPLQVQGRKAPSGSAVQLDSLPPVLANVALNDSSC